MTTRPRTVLPKDLEALGVWIEYDGDYHCMDTDGCELKSFELKHQAIDYLREQFEIEILAESVADGSEEIMSKISEHPFWQCDMDTASILRRAESATVAYSGNVFVYRDGSFEWCAPNALCPVWAAAIPTDVEGLGIDDALKRFLTAIDSAWKNLLLTVEIEAFHHGSTGEEPQGSTEHYLAHWNRGQDYAPYHLKFADARARVNWSTRALTSDEEVVIGDRYYVTDDRLPVKVQMKHPKSGYICLHEMGEDVGKQRTYQFNELLQQEAYGVSLVESWANSSEGLKDVLKS